MIRSNNRRTSLLLGGAGLAMAAMLALPSPAAADAFNASPVFVRGTGNVDRAVTGLDTVTISSSTAVIDWTPYQDNFGNALVFLPNGNTAFFQDAPGQGGFAILNRILPSTNGNVAVFEGTVISRLQNAAGGFSNGGTVAFYSPTGILVGSTAVFDVGRLLLTTLNPDLDSFERFAAGGTLQLAGPAGSTAGITIAAGAQIGAAGEGSYFVAAAPRIAMRGNARINGTSAYVAGEQVNLTYNNGLFDIVIPVGTSVATAIDHSGTTGGPSSTGAGDNHLIYAVARAATNPITVLLSGNLGFDPAVSAGVDNGDIILSARGDVFGRNANILASDPVGGTISIRNGQFTSSVLASASNRVSVTSFDGAVSLSDGLEAYGDVDILIQASNGFDIDIQGATYLQANGTVANGESRGGSIVLYALDGSTLALNGNLTAFADATQQIGTTSHGGVIQVHSINGTIDVFGDANLFANANGFFTGANADAFGGTVAISSEDNGLTRFRGDLVAQAVAFAPGSAGAAARGGNIDAYVQSGGTLDIAGRIRFDTSAWAAENILGQAGGAGTGGFSILGNYGGTIRVGGLVEMFSDGSGGNGVNGGVGGAGTGGQSQIYSDAGTTSIVGLTYLQSSGFGGTGASGGAGTGGLAGIAADGNGRIALASVSMHAHGLGGDGDSANGRGGDGTGGLAQILTQGAGGVQLTGNANVQANGLGGNGHIGGNATGGNAGIYAIFGSIGVVGNAYLSAQAFGGDATVGFGGNGGNATGGTAYVQADGSQSLAASLTIGGNAEAYANGHGGTGGAGDGGTIAAGNGGDGTGGTYRGAPGTGGAYALAGRDNATLSVAGFTGLFARGFGGSGGTGGSGQSGGNGGAGTGGTTQAGTFSGRGDGSLGAGRATFDRLALNANGLGGMGGSGANGLGIGGIGKGGFAGVFANRSRVDATDITTFANGTGGSGSSGGDGLGGDAGIGVVSGTLNAVSLLGRADGSGGSATTGTGGQGIGGEASIDLDSAMTVTGGIDYSANGVGGLSASGNGGLGQGGIARIASTANGRLTVGGVIDLWAEATGGRGRVGGNATGGSALMQLSGNSTVNLADLFLSSAGIGGAGETAGGRGTGGGSQLAVNGGSFTASNAVTLRSDGEGGSGLGTGTGGEGVGGSAGMAINSGSASAASLSVMALGFGGDVQAAGATAGTGRGGVASLIGTAGGRASFGDVSLVANGLAGLDGGSVPTGTAFGGFVEVLAGSGFEFGVGVLEIAADGAGTAGHFDIFANGGRIAIDQLFASALGAIGGETSALRATNGSIPVTDLASIFVTGDLDIITASGGLIGGPTLAAPTASIFIASDGKVTIDGDNDDRISFGGSDLFISSRDLDILAGARIGAEFLGLNVVGNDAITILGGTVQGAGYTLTQDELERIDVSGSASFSSSSAGMASDDILIRDMTVVGSLDDGVSSLFIEAGGIIRVEGVLAYVDAAVTDELSISAKRLEIVTPGGIGIVDANDRPTGVFSFYGRDFWMADTGTIARLRDDVGFTGRNDLLATAASGSSDPLGYLRAGDVSLVVGNSLLVRNSGTASQPAGITVTGRLSFSGGYVPPDQTSSAGPSDQPLDVFAYGRLLNSDGSFVTGKGLFTQAQFNRQDTGDNFVTTYTDASQLNDCVINTGKCTGTGEREEVLKQVERTAPAAAVTTTAPVVSAPVEPSEQEVNVEFGADFPSLVNTSPADETESIDDPVTSGGDIALYGAGGDSAGREQEVENSDEQ